MSFVEGRRSVVLPSSLHCFPRRIAIAAEGVQTRFKADGIGQDVLAAHTGEHIFHIVTGFHGEFFSWFIFDVHVDLGTGIHQTGQVSVLFRVYTQDE